MNTTRTRTPTQASHHPKIPLGDYPVGSIIYTRDRVELLEDGSDGYACLSQSPGDGWVVIMITPSLGVIGLGHHASA